MDRIGRNILRILQEDASISNIDLAERVGLAPSSCHRRVRKFREDGTILKTVVITDPEKMGRNITAIVNVVLTDHGVLQRKHWLQQLEDEPAVSQAYTVSGEADAVFILALSTMAEYQELSEKLFSSDPNVQRFSTMFVLKQHKFDMSLPTKIEK